MDKLLVITFGCHVPPDSILDGTWVSKCGAGDVDGKDYYLRETWTIKGNTFQSVTQRHEELDQSHPVETEHCNVEGTNIEARAGTFVISRIRSDFVNKRLVRMDAVDTPELLLSNSYPYSLGVPIKWRRYYYIEGEMLYPTNEGGFSGEDAPVTVIDFQNYWIRQ